MNTRKITFQITPRAFQNEVYNLNESNKTLLPLRRLSTRFMNVF
jgi:hypothetical protein